MVGEHYIDKFASLCAAYNSLFALRTRCVAMRHKDPSSTMRCYHERAEHLLEVVQEMDNVIPLKK